MGQIPRRWVPVIVALAFLASGVQAFAQISKTDVNLGVAVSGTNSVAFDSVNGVYLVIMATDGNYANVITAKFISSDGTWVSPLLVLAGDPEPWVSWFSVTFGGPPSDPAFLLTYVATNAAGSSHFKYARLIRYQPSNPTVPLVSPRSPVIEVGNEWWGSEKNQSAWDGDQFVVATRVNFGGPFPQPILNHVDMSGGVSPAIVVGDFLDYYGSPSLACSVSDKVCLLTGYASGVPFGPTSMGGAFCRLFSAATLMPVAPMDYLDDHTARAEDQAVVFNPYTRQFLATWLALRAGDWIDNRVVALDGTKGTLDPSRSLGPGAGESRISFNAATRTTLLVSKWAPPGVPYNADIYAVELGDDGAPLRPSNAQLIMPWDGNTPIFSPAVAADSINGRWFVDMWFGFGRSSLVQGTPLVGAGRAANDFNGDGKPDLIWHNVATGQVVAWLMNGPTLVGQFLIATVPDTQWRVVATADMNADGRTDIIWRNVTTGQNAVWYMDGMTVVSQALLPTVPDVNWQIVAATDMNADGKTDIIWRNGATGQNAVWYMDGMTVVSQALLATVPDVNWQVVAAADFNGDGKPDLLWRNVATGQNAVAYLNGATVLSYGMLPAVPDANWRVGTVVDLDGDGRPDVVWRNSVTGQNVVWLMNGVTLRSQALLPDVGDTNWNFAGARMPAAPYQGLAAALAAVAPTPHTVAQTSAGPGQSTVLWRNTATGQNVVWYTSGTTYVSRAELPRVADTAWQIVATADLNGDGQPDIVWRNATTGMNTVWFMNGAVLVAQSLLPQVPDTSWQIVAAADFNGDGKPDLLWRRSTTGEIVVWYLDGTTFLSQAVLPVVPDLAWKIALAVDLNGDGKPDLVWHNVVTGQTQVWYMNGITFMLPGLLPNVPDVNWQIAMAGDFNGDGKLDLVWRNQVTGQNAVWFLNGTALLGQAELPSVASADWVIMRDRR
jgi:hypothetical protein